MKKLKMQGAVVTREKVAGYLLSWSHPAGQGKARFFCSFGFKADEWKILAKALLEHAALHEVDKVEETRFGMRYTVEGAINSPDGRNPSVRAVWFVRHNETAPHLVTAYPYQEEKP